MSACSVAGTESVDGVQPECLCNCKVGYAGPQCTEAVSTSGLLNVRSIRVFTTDVKTCVSLSYVAVLTCGPYATDVARGSSNAYCRSM